VVDNNDNTVTVKIMYTRSSIPSGECTRERISQTPHSPDIYALTP
jgi:hypothetical protein